MTGRSQSEDRKRTTASTRRRKSGTPIVCPVCSTRCLAVNMALSGAFTLVLRQVLDMTPRPSRYVLGAQFASTVDHVNHFFGVGQMSIVFPTPWEIEAYAYRRPTG